MARTYWVLGNWKQNFHRGDATDCAASIAAGLSRARPLPDSVRVGIAPTFVGLESCRPHTGPGPEDLLLLSQNIAAQEDGAYTGEVGPGMLRDVGVSAAIIGHSERRAHFGEPDELLHRKVVASLTGDLGVVLCVGEDLTVRDAGEHVPVVLSQLEAALHGIDVQSAGERLVIAYEPVWAIGTGRTASPAQANEMHGAIRTRLGEVFGDAGAGRSIVYGGSVKPGNAAAIIAEPEVDGFLVGGASLVPNDFLAIVRAAAEAPRP